MIEFVLSLPLLVLVLALVFFFGSSYQRKYYASMAAGYAAARAVSNAEAPSLVSEPERVVDQAVDDYALSYYDLNPQALEAWADAAGRIDPDALALTEAILLDDWGDLRRDLVARLGVSMRPAVDIGGRLNNDISVRGGAAGVCWRRGQVRLTEVVTERELAELDALLVGYEGEALELAEALRALYHHPW